METDEPCTSSKHPTNTNLALVEWSDQRSILTQSSTIPIFRLGHNPTQTITNIVNNQLKIEISHNLTTNTTCDSFAGLQIDWKNSLFKPAGTATNPSKRRECKVVIFKFFICSIYNLHI